MLHANLCIESFMECEWVMLCVIICHVIYRVVQQASSAEHFGGSLGSERISANGNSIYAHTKKPHGVESDQTGFFLRRRPTNANAEHPRNESVCTSIVLVVVVVSFRCECDDNVCNKFIISIIIESYYNIGRKNDFAINKWRWLVMARCSCWHYYYHYHRLKMPSIRCVFGQCVKLNVCARNIKRKPLRQCVCVCKRENGSAHRMGIEFIQQTRAISWQWRWR